VLDSLIASNYLYLTVIAKGITKNESEAKDLVSETYLKLAEKGSKIPQDTDEFQKFFTTCMKNFYLDELRKKKRKSTTIEDTDEITIEVEDCDLSDWKKFIEIESFKALLPMHQEILFELHFENGLSSRKIAKLLQQTGYDVSHNSMNLLIRPIRNKIIKHKWNISNL